ncbi:MAG TPA: hypothetical protein VEK57_07105 [Thermoanaerobaculia bacterium]|nr:hypothetical protein [Thermoanaerobaculia bacterium]
MSRRYTSVLPVLFVLFFVSGAFAQVPDLVPAEAVDLSLQEPREAPEPAAPAADAKRPGEVSSQEVIGGNQATDHGSIDFTAAADTSTAGTIVQSDSGYPDIFAILGNAASSSGFTIFNSSNTALLEVQGNGNVGIGTTSPTTLLQLERNIAGVTALRIENDNPGSETVATATELQFSEADVKKAVIQSIGTGTPESKAVGGPGSLRIINYAEGPIVFLRGTGERMRIATDGLVGIGTNAPQARLHAAGGLSQFMRVEATNANQSAGVQVKNDGRMWQLHVDGTDADKFHIRDGTGNANRLTVDATGQVGIGTQTPTAKLEVNGTVRATSIAGPNWTGAVNAAELKGFKVLGAVYQDVAEWVPATTDLAPGTVVVLNHSKTNEVMASHGAYDTSVAGVVSEQPGLILGMEGEGKEQIATTGRVKVRVDARRGAVAVGDLLVTSDVAGTAMKSEPTEIQGRRFHQPGTIIGKALEPLAGGIGEILVLLSMQ